jgi:hypothetical protein
MSPGRLLPRRYPHAPHAMVHVVARAIDAGPVAYSKPKKPTLVTFIVTFGRR